MSVNTAKLVWLDAPREVVLRDEPLAPPGKGEVSCETIVTAISPGTELAAWRGLAPLRPGNPYPRVVGYCNVARVIEVGPDVEGVKTGERVLTLQSHRSHFTCAARDVYYVLPETADADHIAATYLFHLGYNAVLRGGVRPGSRVLVIGLGALGLTSVAAAVLAGADVTALSDQAAPSQIAEAYGARAVIGREKDASGFDVIISTTNGWSDFDFALRAAAQNATIACLGFPGRDDPPRDFNPLRAEHFYNKQLRIEAVGFSPLENDARGFARFNVRDNMTFLAGAIEDGRLNPGLILSGRYRGSDIAQAYTDLEKRKDDAVTCLLDWSVST